MIIRKSILIAALIISVISAMGQASVFNVMRDASRMAGEHFEEGDYRRAIELYNSVLMKDPGNRTALLRVARSHYKLKEYKKAVDAYQACIKRKVTLQWDDLFWYAESQSVLGNYPVALEYYRLCQRDDPGNEMVSKKIWRITNLQYLYDDSANYAVRPFAGVNTNASELCAVPFGRGVVFASNRKGERPLDQPNGKPTAQFFELYNLRHTSMPQGGSNTSPVEGVEIFAKTLDFPFNIGPVAFFNNETRMVFVANARNQRGVGAGYRPLGLYFARLKDGEWTFESEYQLNGTDYSISDVTINEEGTVLYFSSDMKGGRGGKDIYQSTLVNGKWSGPWNMKEPVNTSGDEVFPYLHRNGTLYFSSNGHPGMGGLDIFESTILPDGLTEPENLGHPVNSSRDDFGLSFDSLATHGYFTSNRAKGGQDDDIYEFDIMLQTYPFVISGALRYREDEPGAPSEIQVWPNAKMALIDTWRDVTLQETVSDAEGKFKFSIPHHSRYHILITDEDGVGHTASLDLGTQRTEAEEHEIVVVRASTKSGG